MRSRHRLFAAPALAALATALVVQLAAPSVATAKQIKEPSTGVGFDPIRKWGKYKMRCIGTCLREKYSFDVYAGCFYVDKVLGKQKLLEFLATPAAKGAYKDGKLNKGALLKNEAFYRWLIRADLPVSIDMTFVRDVPGEKLRATYKEGLGRSMKDKAAMNKFVAMNKGEIKKWQHMTLNIFPGGKVIFQFAGKTNKPIISKDLARGLLGIYFGKKPISKSVKRGLVKNVHWLLK